MKRITLFITQTIQYILPCLVAILLSVQPAVAATTGEVERGIALFHAQQYAASQTLLEHALDTAGKDATVHYYLCRIYFAADQYDRAIAQCKMAVQLQGDQAEYHFWLGRSYGAEAASAAALQQAMLAPKIRKAFERTVALDPTHIHGRIGLINFYLRAPAMMGGSLEKAYAHVRTLIGLNDVEGRLLLARYYEKTDQSTAAEAEYQALFQQYRTTEAFYDISKQYGYFLLRQERAAHAIDVFLAQVQHFPTRAAAYEQLGDGYSADHRWQEAGGAYRHALQLDPAATSIRQKLHSTEKELQKLIGARSTVAQKN
jgi:tetratricopeptide (TPR) repeat protein